MKRWFSARIVLALLILLIAGGWMLLSHGSPLNRHFAIKATQKWARLAPFPSSARDIVVETKGSAFTREFIITFNASDEEIRKWLRDSPGTRETEMRIQLDGTVRYEISPGGGAQFAEVILGKDWKTVRIRAYWS